LGFKIDNSGTIVWQKTIGGNNGDYAKSIIATSDGNYIMEAIRLLIFPATKRKNG
jgi:hypothetical protein